MLVSKSSPAIPVTALPVPEQLRPVGAFLSLRLIVHRECHERPVSKKGRLHSPYIALLSIYRAALGRWRVGSAEIRPKRVLSALPLRRQRGNLKSVEGSLALMFQRWY